jgi:hypothetical protein
VVTLPVSIGDGGTGATSAATALSNLGGISQNQQQLYAVTGGSANAQTATLVPAIGGYADGQVFNLKHGVGPNTGALTLNVNGQGNIAVTDIYGNALTGGECQSGQYSQVRYQSGSFLLLQSLQFLGEHFTWNKAITNGDAQCDFAPLPTMQKFTLNLDRVRSDTSNVDIWLRVETGGSFVTANYNYVGLEATNAPAINSVNTGSDSKIILGGSVGNTDALSLNGEIKVFRPSQTASVKSMHSKTWYRTGASAYAVRDMMCEYGGGAGAITGLRVMANGTNLGGGTATLQGARFS